MNGLKEIIARKAIAALVAGILVHQYLSENTINIGLAFLLAVDLLIDSYLLKKRRKNPSAEDQIEEQLVMRLVLSFVKGIMIIISFLYTWTKAFADGGAWIAVAIVIFVVGLFLGNRIKEEMEMIVIDSRKNRA